MYVWKKKFSQDFVNVNEKYKKYKQSPTDDNDYENK